MEYFLVLWINSNSIITIPKPYQIEQACHDAAKFEAFRHICVPVPERKFSVKDVQVDHTNKVLTCTGNGSTLDCK